MKRRMLYIIDLYNSFQFYHLIKEPFGDNLIFYTFRKIQRYVMCERKLALNGKKAHVKLDSMNTKSTLYKAFK
jgi:hypothetical protein